MIVPRWWFISRRWAAITLFPFVLVQKEKYRTGKLERHEQIHIRQQLELLVIPFYVLYGLNYLVNLILRKENAYREICFEREAYANEGKVDYLKRRKFWAWLRYL